MNADTLRGVGTTAATAAGVLGFTGWGYYVLENTNNFAGAAFLGCVSGIVGVVAGRLTARLGRADNHGEVSPPG